MTRVTTGEHPSVINPTTEAPLVTTPPVVDLAPGPAEAPTSLINEEPQADERIRILSETEDDRENPEAKGALGRLWERMNRAYERLRGTEAQDAQTTQEQVTQHTMGVFERVIREKEGQLGDDDPQPGRLTRAVVHGLIGTVAATADTGDVLVNVEGVLQKVLPGEVVPFVKPAVEKLIDVGFLNRILNNQIRKRAFTAEEMAAGGVAENYNYASTYSQELSAVLNNIPGVKIFANPISVEAAIQVVNTVPLLGNLHRRQIYDRANRLLAHDGTKGRLTRLFTRGIRGAAWVASAGVDYMRNRSGLPSVDSQVNDAFRGAVGRGAAALVNSVRKP